MKFFESHTIYLLVLFQKPFKVKLGLLSSWWAMNQVIIVMYHSLWNKGIQFMKLISWSCECRCQIIKLFTTCSEIGWKFKLNWLSIYCTWFTIPMKLVEPIAKVIHKIVKLSLHFSKFILPKEYVIPTPIPPIQLVGHPFLGLNCTGITQKLDDLVHEWMPFFSRMKDQRKWCKTTCTIRVLFIEHWSCKLPLHVVIVISHKAS